MEPNPSAVQLDIIEFIVRFVHDRMTRVPLPFNNISYPVFDDEFVSAYQWTAEILSKLGLLKPVDAKHQYLYVFICEPENFNDTIRSNAKQIPIEVDCLRCLVNLGEQACVIFEQPFLSFLVKLGILEHPKTTESQNLSPAIHDALQKLGLESDENTVKKLNHILQKNSVGVIRDDYHASDNYAFTPKGKRLKVLMYIQEQGGPIFVEHIKSRTDFLF